MGSLLVKMIMLAKYSFLSTPIEHMNSNNIFVNKRANLLFPFLTVIGDYFIVYICFISLVISYARVAVVAAGPCTPLASVLWLPNIKLHQNTERVDSKARIYEL